MQLILKYYNRVAASLLLIIITAWITLDFFFMKVADPHQHETKFIGFYQDDKGNQLLGSFHCNYFEKDDIS